MTLKWLCKTSAFEQIAIFNFFFLSENRLDSLRIDFLNLKRIYIMQVLPGINAETSRVVYIHR